MKISNFKSYGELDVDFCPNVNCLVGNNGVGKTNLLEAIYYLSFCKGCRGGGDVPNIRRGEEYFAIHGRYGFEGENVQTSCVVRKGMPKQMKCCRRRTGCIWIICCSMPEPWSSATGC